MTSVVTSTGLAHYHEKMKTLLNGKANTNHTHNYAGSSSAGGVANSAAKLATARTIANNSTSLMSFSASFDGSANVTGSLLPRYAVISVGNVNNYPWHRIATYNLTSSYNDASITLFIPGGFRGAPWGIVNINFRSNSKFSDNSANVQWVIRNGYNTGDVVAAIYVASDKAYVDIYLKATGPWGSQVIQVLSAGGRGTLSQVFTLINSSEVNNTTASDAKTSKEAYASIAAGATALYKATYNKTVAGVDAGAVKYASSTDTANKATQDSGGQQINTTYIKGISASGTTFTITKGNGITSTISAECMTNTEIDKLFA